LPDKKTARKYVEWFRHSSPYIHAHRGRTFVIAFGGEAVADPGFANLVHDIALLNALGVRLVLVHGVRPQIEQRLKERGAAMSYERGLRITDEAALPAVKEAVGTVRMEIEALLSMGLANSPMAGARLRVAGGNFVTARPLGVLDGVDYCHTGEVRRVDVEAIEARLNEGAVVLISPLGYSPTGEVFNLSAEDVATAVAVELGADKLLSLVEGPGLTDSRRRLVAQLTPAEAEKVLSSGRQLPEDVERHLVAAVHACRNGVPRAHLIGRQTDGALLLELFTRDGMGTLITSEQFDRIRAASIEDMGGILELIEPLEADGTLVRRSREQLELDIDDFLVLERDGAVLACAALFSYPDEGVGELACLAVAEEYRKRGLGNDLLEEVEKLAREEGLQRLFVLTTQTAHWFRERGFEPAKLADLPLERREMYNYQRNSKVFIKELKPS
jgi:amino-acid N-acetyltransferase